MNIFQLVLKPYNRIYGSEDDQSDTRQVLLNVRVRSAAALFFGGIVIACATISGACRSGPIFHCDQKKLQQCVLNCHTDKNIECDAECRSIYCVKAATRLLRG